MKAVHIVAFILVIIGGLNWGLVGLATLFGGAGASWNVVDMLLGQGSTLGAIVYVLVGLSAILLAVKHGKECKTCSGSSM
ncbi:MAG TPA: DUF378 domain-containing protein [Candidatus Paceibacterota bacterium]|nr:DUF378 domain-containing protein [Candidatus Paceibacterota bacterium]